MLTTVFSHPAWLSLIRSTPAYPFLDDFITASAIWKTLVERRRGLACSSTSTPGGNLSGSRGINVTQ